MSLMAFCTACSVDGVQTREHGHTRRSDLDGVEAALGFHLRDWWQPTADNFLGLLSKNQIVAALNDAGLTGAASMLKNEERRCRQSRRTVALRDPMGAGMDAVPGCCNAGRSSLHA